MAKKTKKDEELLTRVRKRFQLMKDADDENRREAMRDFQFVYVPGEQWDDNMKKERGDRPCYEFNKIRVTAKRIINDMIANPASGKVRAVEGGDVDTAEIYEGLIRNIWNTSNGDSVVDNACEYQVGAGMGAWRITTDFTTDTAFEQDIQIEPIPNPFCLYADPAAKDLLKKDAQDWILTERIATDAFETRWPKAEKIEFESNEFDDDDDWMDDETVRICEYWWKEPTTKEIWQLSDGKVIDAESDEAMAMPEEAIVKRRTVNTDKIMMGIFSGDAILEGPTEWAGTKFPFVMIYGEYMIIDGKVYWYGIGRFAKDAQRSYNVSRTSVTETIAMTPQAKFWATPEQAEGHTGKWAEAHQKNFPFLLYNADPKSPGTPQRMGGADVPIALIQESQIAAEEINMVTGIFAADIGAANQASSGRQEIARQQQGQIATFNYQGNRSKGIQYTWELLIDLIPRVYDTERELRVLGSDGSENYKKVNTFVAGEDGTPIKVNDLAVGRYDTTVTIGPNFSTRRQEAAETYQTLMQANPNIFPVAGDLIFKSMDLPYAEDIAERLKVMLPPQIQEMINEDQEIPPEVQAMMQQAQQAMQMVEQQAQEVQAAAQETEIDKAEVEKLIANLKTEQANFQAQIAKEMANLVQKESQLIVREVSGERDQVLQDGQAEIEERKIEAQNELAGQMAQSMSVIQQMAAQFNELSVQTLARINESAQSRPKLKKITSTRVKGKLVAVPEFEE